MIVETRNNENAFEFDGSIVFLTPTNGPADSVASKIAKCYWPEVLVEDKKQLVSVEKLETKDRDFYAAVAYTDTGWINPARTIYHCLEKIKEKTIALVLKNDEALLSKMRGGLNMSDKKIYLYLIDDESVLMPA